jgi:general secretion pathway protein G
MLLAPALLALALQTPAQPAVTLADLVPKNTVAFVQVPSLERAARFAGRMAQVFGPSGAPAIDVPALLSMIEIPGDPGAIDPARPFGICLLLEEAAGAQPLPAFLVPVRDAQAYLKSLGEGGHAVAKGGYVCVGLAGLPELPSAPAAIARGLPEGEIAARIDLGRLIDQFGETIDQGLNELEAQAGALPASAPGGIDTTPVMGAYVDWIHDLVDSAETLDLALRLEGDELELGLALTNAEGSALSNFGSKEKTGLRALAGLLETDSGLSMLMGMDAASLMKRFQPFFDALPAVYPEPMRPAMKQLFEHMADFYGFMGTAQAASMDFTDSGMRYRVYSKGGDPLKLLDVYRKLGDSLPGFEFRELAEREVAGLKVSGMRLKFDIAAMMKGLEGKDQALPPELDSMMAKLFGKDGLALQVASKDGLSVMVMGGDEEYLRSSLARMSSKSAPPPFLARALQQVGDLNPCLIVRYDLGRMMTGIKDLVANMVPLGAGAFSPIALSFSAWGGVDGRVWRGAMAANLSEIAALAQLGNAGVAQVPVVKAKADVETIMQALIEYAINNSGNYPDSLEPLVTPDANGRSYLEGYDQKIPKDPWGHEYQYEPGTAQHPLPRVWSYGSDGAPGGTGDAADLDSDRIREEK